MELYKKKEKNITEDDPKEYGSVYTLTAMKTDTRLFISHHEGQRTAKDATELFNDVEQRRDLTVQLEKSGNIRQLRISKILNN